MDFTKVQEYKRSHVLLLDLHFKKKKKKSNKASALLVIATWECCYNELEGVWNKLDLVALEGGRIKIPQLVQDC